MGLFGNLVKLATDVVVLPLAVAKDVVTLGGAVTDEDPATLDKLGDIVEDIEDVIENED